MKTTQIQQNQAIEPRGTVEVYQPNEEFVCANCGYGAVNGDEYAYHIKLCSIPA